MKRAISTLLSLTMMFSILAQGPVAYAEGEEIMAPAVQEEILTGEETQREDPQSEEHPQEETPVEDAPEPTPAPEGGDAVNEHEPAEEPMEEAPAEETSAEEASEVIEEKTEEPELLQKQEDTQLPAESDTTPAGPTGGVEVTVLAGLPMGEKDLTVTLTTKDSETYQSQTLRLPAPDSSDPTATVRFSGLAAGTYTLTVSGGGFAPYTQDLTVADLIYQVQLCAGPLQTEAYADGQPHPGVLLIGDVVVNEEEDENKESLNQEDVDALIASMENGDTDGDLDGNGVVDLVDLQMLANSLSDTTPVYSSISAKIPAEMTTATSETGTQVEGELEDLLTGNGGVTLKPESDAAISAENPVQVSFDFTSAENEAVPMGGIVLQTPPVSETSSSVTGLTVVVEGEDGKEYEYTLGAVGLARLLTGDNITAQEDGSIVVDFGGQIAVKKVTIKITATSNSSNLAEISKVEFVNDMESRIPAPTMNIPENLTAEPGSQTFTLRWDAQVNVTGYEVKITLGDQTETIRAGVNSLTVNSFQNGKIKNGQTYTVQVQSVNGAWSSGYSAAITVTPKADKLPAAPDALKLTGRFQRIQASWKDMKDTDTYNLYYRVQGEGEFTKVEGIESNGYTIQGLQNNTAYEVYVTGVNELGEGPASLTSVASTANVNPVKMPAYNLINTPGNAGEVTAHIQSVTHSAGYMKDSPLDSGNTAWGVVDNDFASWYGINDWDDGGNYPDQGGVRITFDDTYNIGSISLAQAEDRGYYGYVRVYAKKDGQEYQVPNVSIVKHSDGSRSYYTIKIAGGVETDYLRVCVGYLYWATPVSISEMRFYRYDSLEDDILALYADDLHLELKEDVNEATIAALQERLDTPDSVSGELHPEREALQKELDNAKGLLDNQLKQAVEVHTTISASYDGHLGFNGLNAWQPLGVTAQAGEELVIYVGSNTGSTGASTSLQLIATQYNAEYSDLVSSPIPLKVGRNEITIPELSTVDTEHGGALYVQYTGSKSTDQYSVRVSGGVQTPTLDLYGVEDEAQRKALVTAYVEELTAYAAQLETLHTELHPEEGAYDAENCILNTTDIMLDQMMYSVPVTQVLSGLGSGSTEQRAEKLLTSLDAMDQMMLLFYQHKGLTNLEGAGDRNRLPAQHLNIRYMRMFAGAFMYAAGNHIGIGWGSVPGLMGGEPIQLKADGSYESGGYFGWGIAHEIGHNINQGNYAVAEVTNNYFSQISQAMDGVRFSYDDIYAKVTSGTTGQSSNVFTQLGMYWQLHLAYDTGYEYELYDFYEELFNSRFFARVDTYSRTPSAANELGDVPLTLGSNADQNFMRLASAAAQKDLTDFFERWGMTPDATTAAYMAQFEPETRALYYGNNDSRTYRFTNSADTSFAGKAVLTEGTTAVVDDVTPNQVNLTLASSADEGLVLGYEIARVTYENGKAQTQVVGFATGNTFTDTVTTINNRTVAYQITAVDQFLNRSESMLLPAVKISHDGSYDKSLWTASTNMVSVEDGHEEADEKDPCAPETVSAITQVIDNDKGTTYTGKTESGDAVITLNFHKSLAVTALKYTVTSGTPIQSYQIQITSDGSQWNTVATGTFSGQEVNTVYFPDEEGDPWVTTYDATQVRLIIQSPGNAEISVTELDVLGPTGDDVALQQKGIGILTDDFVYDKSTGAFIPEGSLVFTGSYKGNPAYNVVLLYDQDGNVVGGVDAEGNLVASQIILAEVPEQGELGEVSEGSWVYWIEPQDLEAMNPLQTVRVELYRVDNATTNEGQRLTSDTLAVQMPEKLPPITLGGN